ncbi:MAG: hypothetical protein S4CHLAM123_03490 [Chlamydiales bacterium]|nr:hypothetical protein [Chlamydiales bacterium]
MLSSGQQYKNFTVISEKAIPEIQCTLLEITHTPTGAYIVHLVNDDDENLFNLSFRTYPERSDGVAHILEHTVLCGSQKFPIRDPFFSMSKRSLNTFMNALTGSDFTCYPASSQVPADFYNLLNVYLDAVFKPSLTKLSFLQEGHRLEFLTPDDPNTPLLYKGVVFNEMKGAMAPSDARLAQALMSALFPDVTYGINSGGDPKEIPNLTYEDLIAFHQKYYHPSRCLFYFYGNIATEQHLDYLEEHAFKDVQPLPPLPAMPKQKRFTERKTLKMHYPMSEEKESDQKMLLGMSWLTCSILDQQDLLALNILDVALTGTDASPLKMALLKSGLCKQADSSLDNDLNEIPFLVVCKGCEENAADALEELVRTHLQKFVQEGIPDHLIEGAIHQIEFSHKEITGNSSPYGLSLFWRSCLLKQHGGELEDGLKIHTLFQQLHARRKDDPSYFPKLIQKYFLDNPHFVRVEMHPDKQLASKELEEEKQRLINLCQTLQSENIQDLILQSQALEQLQESSDAEDLDVLPKVTLADVNPKSKEFVLNQESLGSLQLYSHACCTNDITYADLVFDLPHVEPEKFPLLRLFSVFLTHVGCGDRNYVKQLDYLLEHTGGVGTSLDLCLQASNPTQMRPYFSIRGKALNRKLDKLFPLFTDLITNADFTDVDRLGELLMQHLHGIESSIQKHSLRYAVSLAARGCSTASTIMSSWSGLDYYWALKKIVADFEKSPDALVHTFEQFQTQMLGLEGGQLVISTDRATLEQLKQTQFYGLSELPTKRFQPWSSSLPPQETHSQGRIISSPVAFTASLFSTVPYTHKLSAALSIASEIMENKTLHTRIREQGGAYGSGAVNSTLSGQFYFYTYRDPHLKTSLDAFRESIQEIAAGDFTPTNIEEAQLGIFQQMDSPIPPGSRAHTAYIRLRGGLIPEKRQQFRTRLLNCTTQEIQEAVTEILIPGFEKAVTVVFAGKDMLEKENALLDKKLNLYPVEAAYE